MIYSIFLWLGFGNVTTFLSKPRSFIFTSVKQEQRNEPSPRGEKVVKRPKCTIKIASVSHKMATAKDRGARRRRHFFVQNLQELQWDDGHGKKVTTFFQFRYCLRGRTHKYGVSVSVGVCVCACVHPAMVVFARWANGSYKIGSYRGAAPFWKESYDESGRNIFAGHVKCGQPRWTVSVGWCG